MSLERTADRFPSAQADPDPWLLMVPGLDNSGPRHWQTHWEQLPRTSRVEFGEWSAPRLHAWLPALDRAIRESPRPLILVAHSLGCIATVWWAALHGSDALRDKVIGALLVAPPDVDALDTEPRIRDFRPLPRMRLPFPSILVASWNDPHARIERSREMAALWGARFVDAGAIGHINAESNIGEWSAGLRHVAELSGGNPNLLVAELGLRTAFA